MSFQLKVNLKNSTGRQKSFTLDPAKPTIVDTEPGPYEGVFTEESGTEEDTYLISLEAKGAKPKSLPKADELNYEFFLETDPAASRSQSFVMDRPHSFSMEVESTRLSVSMKIDRPKPGLPNRAHLVLSDVVDEIADPSNASAASA